MSTYNICFYGEILRNKQNYPLTVTKYPPYLFNCVLIPLFFLKSFMLLFVCFSSQKHWKFQVCIFSFLSKPPFWESFCDIMLSCLQSRAALIPVCALCCSFKGNAPNVAKLRLCHTGQIWVYHDSITNRDLTDKPNRVKNPWETSVFLCESLKKIHPSLLPASVRLTSTSNFFNDSHRNIYIPWVLYPNRIWFGFGLD